MTLFDGVRLPGSSTPQNSGDFPSNSHDLSVSRIKHIELRSNCRAESAASELAGSKSIMSSDHFGPARARVLSGGRALALSYSLATESPPAMLTQTKSAETWQTLMELRCRREVLERWIASQVLPDGLQHSLQTMLTEVEDQIRIHTNGRG